MGLPLRSRPLVLVVAGLAVAAGLFGCTSSAPARAASRTTRAAAAANGGRVYPQPSWETIPEPGTVGWTRAGLERVRARLVRTQSTAFMVVVGGRALMEYGDVTAVGDVASVRKSVLSMLIGMHVARGSIHLDSTLAELGIDDLGGLTAAEKEATVRDLLSARSGIFHEAANAGDDHASAPPRGSRRHGTYFLYNNWDFNALGTIFEQRTGTNLYDAFAAELAAPLGMEDFDRRRQRKSGDLGRSIHPAYHFHLSTRDLARLGYLMLREGSWQGRQLVPRDWVVESTGVVTPVAQMNPARLRQGPLGYGYLWWVWDGRWATGPYRGAFTGHGLGGQHITVLPALDLVVAHETRQDDGRVSHAEFLDVLDRLVDARCPRTPC